MQEIGCDHFIMNLFDCWLSLCNSSENLPEDLPTNAALDVDLSPVI